MNFKVQFTPQASQQLRELIEWWSTNRTAARPLPREVKRVITRLAESPHIGKIYRQTGTPILRRPLKNTPYWLFYEVDDDSKTVFVVAAWSAERGEGLPI